MNVLIYLGHPAQYHFIKLTAKQLILDGHRVKILIKTKDVLENLLKEDGWEYENIQSSFRSGSKFSIFKASLKRTHGVLRVAKRFKADILIGTDSSIAQAAWMLRKPALTTLEDDVDVIYNLARLTFPFTDGIVVPEPCRVGKWEKKKIPYYGYMKLAYLHPRRFSPDFSIVKTYGIDGNYMLIRLAKLVAHHDTGIHGLNIDLVLQVIRIAEERGLKVYVSSESDIDSRLSSYQLRIRHTDIHHIMAYATLLVSDSQSMSVEAAMLGIPSIRFSDFSGRISVLEELENRYKLTYGIKTSNPVALLEKESEWLSLPDIQSEFRNRREKMLAEKIDVTAFLTWFIEHYPESKQIIKENPTYQLRFR